MVSKVYVGNLSWDTTEDVLAQLFSRYGQLVDYIVMKDRETGRSRGFGFVTYATQEEADTAIAQLNEYQLDGRTIRVNMANARPRNNYNAQYAGGFTGYGGYGPAFGAPGAPSFGVPPAQGFGALPNFPQGFDPAAAGFGAPAPGFGSPAGFAPAAQGYGSPQAAFATQAAFGAPSPQPGFGAPQGAYPGAPGAPGAAQGYAGQYG